VAISTSAESVAARVLALVGLGDDPALATFEGRAAQRERVDARMAEWIGARTQAEVLATFEEAQVAATPVYNKADIAADPHLRARGALAEVDGVVQQGLVARLSATPGRIRHAGRPLGADQGVLDEPDPWAALEAAAQP